LVKEAGDDLYVEVKRMLKPYLEVYVLQEKLANEGRFPVIYCPEIEGCNLPLVTNIFGSYKLAALALDLNINGKESEILHEYKRREDKLRPPQMVPASEAPVKEVILRGKDVDLNLLPIPHHCKLDSGKYITIGCMICKDPDTGISNAGVYRHEVKGKDQLGCMIDHGRHANYIARRYAELGKPMEVTIFIGHHPAVVWGTLARGSIDVNELEVAGALLDEPLQMTPAETVDLPVPARAEIAIEGIIDPHEIVTDGPFAEYPGYYGEGEQPAYLIKVTAITMRKDAIYQDLAPAQLEHTMSGLWGKLSLAYDAVKRAVPSVQAVNLPFSGRHLFLMYVSIKQRIPGEAKQAALAALGSLYLFKVAVMVDDDIDVFNEEEVLWAIATRVTADQDIIVIPRVEGDLLDPAGYNEPRLKTSKIRGSMHSKVIIDATKPVTLPFPTRVTPHKELWDSIKLEEYI